MRKPRTSGARPVPATGPRETADADGDVRAVDRTLAILQAFGEEDGPLPLVEAAAIAAPVLDAAGRTANSIGITMPLHRLDATAEALCLPPVLRQAAALMRALGGDPALLARQEDARPWRA